MKYICSAEGPVQHYSRKGSWFKHNITILFTLVNNNQYRLDVIIWDSVPVYENPCWRSNLKWTNIIHMKIFIHVRCKNNVFEDD